MLYREGDMVIYAEPCSDHRNSPLVLGEVYEVARAGASILLSKNGRHLWWVLKDSIVPYEENYKVQQIIRKINAIDKIRKELGYAF